ncbi:AAA family ATPase [Acinetobacter ursingii]|uniref:AAA family ATPase n=1 Tax=Acinetobacter ursingii TaxID=108980 RepID=UPI00195DEAC7|nr:AAA family ATPase [Acinetobacter ursingii]VTX93499.1 AAA domain protein [Acinetobacter ursingii]
MHINPDFYLQTPQGRIFSEAFNLEAWEQCYRALDDVLMIGTVKKVYLLIGAQGSGKTTWAKQQYQREPNCVFFDAILVKKSERKIILDKISRFDIPCIAVYFNTSLEECLMRNRQRADDEIVNEQALKNVFQAIEVPQLDEGFESIFYF